MTTKGDKTKNTESLYDKYRQGKMHDSLFEVDGLTNTKIYIGNMLKNKSQTKSLKLFNPSKTFINKSITMWK